MVYNPMSQFKTFWTMVVAAPRANNAGWLANSLGVQSTLGMNPHATTLFSGKIPALAVG